jgi:hypothetical protein
MHDAADVAGVGVDDGAGRFCLWRWVLAAGGDQEKGKGECQQAFHLRPSWS